MSSESKQSSPIGDVVFEKEFSNWYFDIKNGTGFTPSVSEIIYFFKQRIAGSQWASSAHPTAVNGDDYHEQRVKYIGLLESVKIALSYRDFGVLNEYLATIGENKIETPIKEDEKFFCRYEYDGNERCETVCGLCSQVKPKAAAPKADVKSKEGILGKYINGGEIFRDHFQPQIFQAMEEYANQFKTNI